MSTMKQGLEAWLEQLRDHRLSGMKAVEFQGGSRVEYKSDAEMERAYAFGQKLLEAEQGRHAPPKTILFSTSKGL